MCRIISIMARMTPSRCCVFDVLQVRCLQIFGKSISDCAEFMCLNLFEAKANVQGCVQWFPSRFMSAFVVFIITNMLLSSPHPLQRAIFEPTIDVQLLHPSVPWHHLSSPHITCRFRLFTQTGAPAQATALHDAARDQVWSKTKEILQKL